MKIVVFDFCGTLTTFQTFDPFLEYVIRKRKGLNVLRRFISMTLMSQRFSDYFKRKGKYKRLLVWLVCGTSENELYELGKEYYRTAVVPNLLPVSVDRLISLKQEGYIIVIASAGSKYYIKYFAKEFGVDAYITAELYLKKYKCTGKLKDECVGENKSTRLKDFLNAISEDEKVDEIIGFTDSYSDMPMLRLCTKQVVISEKKHQKWVSEEMEEIIW